LRFPEWFELREGKSVKRISSTAVRSVLRVIEDRAGVESWCTIPNDTLVAESCVKISQVKRALTVLDNEGLIIRSVVRTGTQKTFRRTRPNWDQYLDSSLSSLSATEKEELRAELAELAGTSNRVKLVSDDQRSAPERVRSAPERVRSAPERVEVGPSGGAPKRSDKRVKRFKIDNPIGAPYRAIGLNFDQGRIARTLHLIDRITSRIDIAQTSGSFTHKQNFEAVAKLAALTVGGGAPESWLAESLESVRQKDESVSVAYLMACFRKRFRAEGSDLGAVLKSVYLPEELRWIDETIC